MPDSRKMNVSVLMFYGIHFQLIIRSLESINTRQHDSRQGWIQIWMDLAFMTILAYCTLIVTGSTYTSILYGIGPFVY